MTGRLANKVAIITGASSGIGRATALLMAREGAAVVCSDIRQGPPTDPGNSGGGSSSSSSSTHEEIQRLGGRAAFVACNTSNSAQVQALIKAAVAEFGRLDIMFNNAGVGKEGDKHPNTMLWEYDEDDFDETMAVNVRGVFLGCKYAAAHMKDQEPLVPGGDRGWIVNTGSIMALNAIRGITAYAASKHAVLGITKAAALDCAPFNIHVNAVNPGFVTTVMTQKMLSNSSNSEALSRLHPLKGIGKVEDIARAVLFLVSEDASWITGESLCVDGGFNAM
ncbi:uncharacterized protein PpBr36_09427 [Pyricularia pennisetigena]|uniref:uncharacterized protein n=1 Tax=Pyricularia pennisetigena TaxID=1578925 RepID=UPI00114D6D4A|nr:uncharacterized protein PpBr36_09427 [Pyricularia pennisetigena]TLS21935.1 hypothetical protein PpBr36_09427 [Pyricularia pennisetigena]